MNKYLYYENKICKLIEKYNEKYNCAIQLVENLPANACILKYDNKHLIFVSKRLDKKLLPLTILHEFGHIHFKTIRKDPKKYNYFIELLSNIYAINRLFFSFSLGNRIILFFLLFTSEKKLYNYYLKNTKIGGEHLYEQLFNK